MSLHLEREKTRSNARLTLVGLEDDYILKPQSPQWKKLSEAEHFCMLLARHCKIRTAEFGLVPLKSGELAYITRRMDRENGHLRHMEDFCQILDKMTSQKYSGSMEQIGKALRKYSNAAGLDSVRLLELTVFCFLTGNSDMHLKNFSLLRLEDGRLELSPAYDLVPMKVILPADTEELALTLNGKKNRLKKGDFECFGNSLKLTPLQITKTMNRIVEAVEKNLVPTLSASFLPEMMKTDIRTLIQNRLFRLMHS
ncbi:MAG: HipA domain-containing protein [Victivallales bacterium]|nr:HipA domain-containing protein [Victivallales bacterium]